MTHPYRSLPDHCFWSRGVTWAPPGQVDPFVGTIALARTDRVATIGSCFAQHLSRHIERLGFHYFVPESAPPDLSESEAVSRQFGVFSARYGNVYTVRQALQLFRRAFGEFTPSEDVWARGDRFVDAFRPQIEPAGHATADEVRAAATEHLVHVRSVFESSDWLVLTLGLTEAFQAKADGAVYPIAPGVAGGVFDDARHAFVNFSAREVHADLVELIERMKAINPRLRILLTVSPVPLIATYESRHVLVSTAASKAILRTVADEVERAYDHVTYFPSYEIITSSVAAQSYYDDTLRGVTPQGVAHVMRVFSRSVSGVESATNHTGREATSSAPTRSAEVVCDEETIEAAIRAVAPRSESSG